jgi:hypothetical protein
VRIEFERSGGFAGAVLRTVVDTSELPEERRREWEALVRAATPFGAAASARAVPGRPDRFEYRLRVSGEHGAREGRAGEAELTPAQRELVARLMAHLREGRRRR